MRLPSLFLMGEGEYAVSRQRQVKSALSSLMTGLEQGYTQRSVRLLLVANRSGHGEKLNQEFREERGDFCGNPVVCLPSAGRQWWPYSARWRPKGGPWWSPLVSVCSVNGGYSKGRESLPRWLSSRGKRVDRAGTSRPGQGSDRGASGRRAARGDESLSYPIGEEWLHLQEDKLLVTEGRAFPS